MNPQWFGDSFDIVKRFFVENLNEIGYHVVVDPMLTGEWNGPEHKFYRVYAESCGLILAFLGSGGRNAATIFSFK